MIIIINFNNIVSITDSVITQMTGSKMSLLYLRIAIKWGLSWALLLNDPKIFLTANILQGSIVIPAALSFLKHNHSESKQCHPPPHLHSGFRLLEWGLFFMVICTFKIHSIFEKRVQLLYTILTFRTLSDFVYNYTFRLFFTRIHRSAPMSIDLLWFSS